MKTCRECNISKSLENFECGRRRCRKCRALYLNNYYKDNRTKLIKQNVSYGRKKLNEQPLFRLKQNLKRRLNLALKGELKSQNTISLIGCSIEELRRFIENKFKVDMSWQNYGTWHIDHIKPCASFDLSSPEQQEICFNYKNLQPLWANENLSKGKKYEEKSIH